MAPNLENSSVRLTAYVLGELSEAERLVVERELAHSPEARGELAELQATSSLLFAALQSEPTPPRFPAIAAALLAAAEQSPPEQTVTTVSSYHPPRARAGFALVSIVVAAAAMLLVLCSLPNPSERTLAWNQPQAVDYQAINDFAWSGLADGRSTPGVNHFFPHVPGKGGGGRPSTVRYDSYQEGQSGAVVRGNGRAPGMNVPHALGRQIAPQTPAVRCQGSR